MILLQPARQLLSIKNDAVIVGSVLPRKEMTICSKLRHSVSKNGRVSQTRCIANKLNLRFSAPQNNTYLRLKFNLADT